MSTKHPSVKVALGSEFLTAYARLPQSQQKKVREFCDKFMQNPASPGINYERLQAARDANLRSVRIDQNYRGIVLQPERGDVYVLLWVDKHDDAYTWAQNRVCHIHPETGALQLFEISSETAPPAGNQETKSPPPAKKPDGKFAPFTNEELVSLGVPEASLDQIRLLVTDHDLDTAEGSLPQDAFEALYLLAAGYTIEEVKADLGRRKPESEIDTSDFARAIDTDEARRSFVVVTDHMEMEKILRHALTCLWGR